jgi:hypothetical protein
VTTIDSLIVRADLAAASLRARAPLATPLEARPDRLERPRRRRHRALPIEYRISRSELIIMGTALGILIGALTFPLAWILFGITT